MHVVPEMPTTGSGKVLKNTLKSWFGPSTGQSAASLSYPQTAAAVPKKAADVSVATVAERIAALVGVHPAVPVDETAYLTGGAAGTLGLVLDGEWMTDEVRSIQIFKIYPISHLTLLW